MPVINLADIKLIEEGKVDSRVRMTAGNPTQTHPIYHLEKVYCVYCGCPKGWVTQESSKYIAANNIIAVCDSCYESLGSLPLEEAKIREVNIP